MLNLGKAVTKESMVAYATAKKEYMEKKSRLNLLEEVEYPDLDEKRELAALHSYPFKDTLNAINKFTKNVINQDSSFFTKLQSFDLPSEYVNLIFAGGLE